MKILLLIWKDCFVAALLAMTVAFSALGDDFTTELNGVDITYQYSEGQQYNVRFSKEGIKYRYLSGEAPEEWWGPFPYRAFKTNYGQYFAGWYEKGYGDQITLLIDLKEKTLLGSGIIIKKDRVIEHFEKAKIIKILAVK